MALLVSPWEVFAKWPRILFGSVYGWVGIGVIIVVIYLRITGVIGTAMPAFEWFDKKFGLGDYKGQKRKGIGEYNRSKADYKIR